jgi:hypothetical protein
MTNDLFQMTNMTHSTSNKLYWKISATFMLMMVVLGVAYVLVSVYSARNYFHEVNQRLYGDLAEHLVNEPTTSCTPSW